MPNQVTQKQTDEIVFPDGVALEVSDDGGSTFFSLGVMATGTTATYNYDKIITESGNAGTLRSRIKNQTIALAPSALYTQDPEVWEKFSGGAFTFTDVPGSLVAGAIQNVLDGNWAFDSGIVLSGQNGDGTAPTINSVTGSVDGAVGADDFDLSKVGGGWVLTPRDGTIFTTEAQDIAIDTDYTPSEGKRINAGTSSLELSTFIARLRHYTDDALTLFDTELIVHAADLDSGMAFMYKGVNEDGVNEVTVAFTGKVDTSRTDGDQLFQLFIAAAAYTN